MPREPKEKAYRLCSLLGNDIRNHEEIVKFLKTINVKKLIQAQEQVLTKMVKKLLKKIILHKIFKIRFFCFWL